MLTLIFLAFLTLIWLLLIDGFWLVVVARRFYARHLGPLLRPRPDWRAAALFYPLYALGMTYLVVFPGLASSQPELVWLRGAILGLLCYATYDLTNQATLKGWSRVVTLVDVGWGAVMTGTVAWLSYTTIAWFIG